MGRHKKDKERRWWGSRELTPMTSKGSGQGSDTFTCSVDGVTACSKAPKADILFDSRLWQSVVGLCERFDTEWMAYLIGEKREDGDYEIKSLSFPEQSAGGAHVRREPDANFRPEEGTVGVIHSHVGMQAFFSHTDKAHANWPVEIVVNRKGEYEVSTRVTLPCGDSMRRSSRVLLLTGGQLDAMEGKLKEALEKGKEKEQANRPTVLWSSAWPSEYGYGHMGLYGVASQRETHSMLGGKYLFCPIPDCGKYASGTDCCSHTLKEMEEYVRGQEANKQVTP